jgi:16S rRNA (adenine1518-N6/adenine1519-N6)-dimethyltransferase
MYKKKSLGQHFLNNRHYLTLVADAADIKKGETVVEIGPGEGALTSVLLERGARVVAIEKDSRLIDFLRKKFKGEKLEIIEGDALEYEPAFKKFKVVGNVPYYITGALFKKFLSGGAQPSTLVFLVQKEVGERIARSKKESILSLSVKAYGTPLYIKSVPKGAFVPPPKVDSAIIAVKNISRDNFKSFAQEEKFFELVKKAFGGKRKMLRSTIGIDSNMRPEDLSLKEWLTLARR